jgi:uncharacterized protein YceH (UPF0502 family)
MATVDIAGAARASGLSVKAIRGRVERGSLPAELVDGRRRIPISALLAAGLLVDDPAKRPGAPRSANALEARVAALEAEVASIRADLGRLR